jgi:hypothetical protein
VEECNLYAADDFVYIGICVCYIPVRLIASVNNRYIREEIDIRMHFQSRSTALRPLITILFDVSIRLSTVKL